MPATASHPLQAHTTRPTRVIPCRVSVTTATGDKHRYYTLSRSTCAAVMDALDRFDICKVRVQAIRSRRP